MSLVEQIDRDLVAAMKAREELKLSVLRMIKTVLKLKQTEQSSPLDDAQAATVLRTLLKQRRDSVEQFRKGGREDLAAKEESEITIVQSYLPAEANDQQIEAAVAAAIGETGAVGQKDFGNAMKAAMAKLAGQNADGKRVSEILRARLGA